MRYEPHQAVWSSKIKDNKLVLTVHLAKGSYKLKVDNTTKLKTVMSAIIIKENGCRGKYLPGSPMKPCYRFEGVRLMEGDIGGLIAMCPENPKCPRWLGLKELIEDSGK